MLESAYCQNTKLEDLLIIIEEPNPGYFEPEDGQLVDQDLDDLFEPEHEDGEIVDDDDDGDDEDTADTEVRLSYVNGKIVAQEVQLDYPTREADTWRDAWFNRYVVNLTEADIDIPLIPKEHHKCVMCDGAAAPMFRYCHVCVSYNFQEVLNLMNYSGKIVRKSHIAEIQLNPNKRRFSSVREAAVGLKNAGMLLDVTAARICAFITHAVLDRIEHRYGDSFRGHYRAVEKFLKYMLDDQHIQVELERDDVMVIKTAYYNSRIQLYVTTADDTGFYDRIKKELVSIIDQRRIYVENGGTVVGMPIYHIHKEESYEHNALESLLRRV